MKSGKYQCIEVKSARRDILGTTVDIKVFTPGVGTDVPRVRPLEAFDEGCGEGTTQIWIFPVRLLERTIGKLIGLKGVIVKESLAIRRGYLRRLLTKDIYCL